MIGSLATVEAEMGDHGTRIETAQMVLELMPELLAEHSKLLQPPVNSLVSSKNFPHRTSISVRDNIVGSADASLATIATVGNHKLSNCKKVFELGTKDADIRPSTGRKGTVCPHDISSLNADSNLVP